MNSTLLNAVIGKPIGHSLSPKLHNAFYKTLGLESVLLPFEVEDLEAYLQAARTLSIPLTAVTMPYKEAILPLLDEVDPLAKELGAVNTVLQKDGRLWGYNTDFAGIAAALKGTPLKGKKALVLGSGGVARPLVHFLKKEGALITLCSRNVDKLKMFEELYGIRSLPWENRESFVADFIANTTPLGMTPHEEESPLSADCLNGVQTVFDVVYNPSPTRLLREAAARGARCISGLDMFVAQAAEQIYLWKGLRPQLNSYLFLLS